MTKCVNVVCQFQGLLCAHDAISQKDYFPRLPEIPLEVDEDEETIKIVQLVKSNEPLVRILTIFTSMNNIFYINLHAGLVNTLN